MVAQMGLPALDWHRKALQHPAVSAVVAVRVAVVVYGPVWAFLESPLLEAFEAFVQAFVQACQASAACLHGEEPFMNGTGLACGLDKQSQTCRRFCGRCTSHHLLHHSWVHHHLLHHSWIEHGRVEHGRLLPVRSYSINWVSHQMFRNQIECPRDPVHTPGIIIWGIDIPGKFGGWPVMNMQEW